MYFLLYTTQDQVSFHAVPGFPMTTAHLDLRLSDRLSSASPSATGAVSELARRLAGQGRAIISLSEGELDFDTPAHIQHAAIKGIVDGHTRYTGVGGSPASCRTNSPRYHCR